MYTMLSSVIFFRILCCNPQLLVEHSEFGSEMPLSYASMFVYLEGNVVWYQNITMHLWPVQHESITVLD